MISIVLPTWNRCAFLAEAVGSVVSQRIPDWELVIVDDGSTDGTGAWLASLDDSRIRVLQTRPGETGTGVAGTRNLGARKAQGEWICFLDDDDRLHSATLAHLHATIETMGDVRWIWGRRWITDAEGRATHLEAGEEVLIEQDAPESAHFAAAKLVTSGLTVHRNTFLHVGGFDESLCVSEDRDLVYRLIANGCTGIRVPEPFVWFREHDAPRASSVDGYAEKNASDLRVVERNLDYLQAHPEVFSMHLHRVASRQRKAGDIESARDTVRMILDIMPGNWKARRRWLAWNVVNG